jgi:hypothetical protein
MALENLISVEFSKDDLLRLDNAFASLANPFAFLALKNRYVFQRKGAILPFF